VQAKIKNLRTGSMLSRSFKQADRFEEADLELLGKLVEELEENDEVQEVFTNAE
ncbi:MAG: hypothetical protein UY52_C0045G0001, partial [Parcubacteria group bacterium GW2011_GWC2_49_9]